MAETYTHGEAVSLIWSIADLLRGAYKAHAYGDVILPLVVLRRLDQALAATKQDVLDKDAELVAKGIDNREPLLRATSDRSYYNTSPLTFDRLLDDEDNVVANLRAYIEGFSTNARDVIDKFHFDAQIDKLATAGLLYAVLARFVDVDLHPDRVSNMDMGYVFEELIRKFAEMSNETAGEHFTPREVIALMVDLLFAHRWDRLEQPGAIVTMYDPAAGTGGMLSVAEDHLHARNPNATLVPFAQEINDESYAICKADMLIKGQRADNVAFGNSFTEDAFAGKHFDYCIANPPYGVDWKGYHRPIQTEHDELGHDGRFGPGLPSKSDGQLLFLLHMLDKCKPADEATGEGGGRMAIIMNGSPLFTGAPGGGESEIRRHVIEHDLLEAVVALPDQLFYNTGISTYVWILTRSKPAERRGSVALVDGRELFQKMRKSLGNKRNELGQHHIEELVRLYREVPEDDDRVEVLPNHRFGFRRVTIERPRRARYDGGPRAVQRLREHEAWEHSNLRMADRDRAEEVLANVEEVVGALPEDGITLNDAMARVKKDADYKALLKKAKEAVLDVLSVDDPDGPVMRDRKGRSITDSDLRGQETVPLPDNYDPFDADTDWLREGVDEYVEAEVLPHAPEAWPDHSKTKLGYEIPVTRIFYTYEPPRPLEEIDADLRKVEREILDLLSQVTG